MAPERVGVILEGIDDLQAGAALLAQILAQPTFDRWLVRRLGLEPILVEPLWIELGQDLAAIERVCAVGLAWALGRRSARRADGWEPVASLPTSWM